MVSRCCRSASPRGGCACRCGNTVRPWSGQGTGIILVSLVIGWLLALIELPQWAETIRPAPVALILIYWSIHAPRRVGVGVGWITGLVQDALQATLLGFHALGYAIVVFLCVKLHQRMRVYPVWQQASIVLLLLALLELIGAWVNGILGHPAPAPERWLAPVLGAALWPWIAMTLRFLQRRYHVR